VIPPLLLLCKVTFVGNTLGMGCSFSIYLETLQKSSSIFIDEENFSKAKLLCLDGLEVFTVNPARPEEVGPVSSFTVRNSTVSKSANEIWNILWAEKR